MHWRLKIDVPYDFAVEPGIQMATHCRDFRPEAGALADTYRDPTTGVVMLRPSFLKREWFNYAKGLDQFRYNPQFWQSSLRGSDGYELTGAFTNIVPAGSTPALIEILTDVAIIAIQNIPAGDTLKWSFETKFNLTVDEGFVLHVHALADELMRKNNWLYVQWDDIGIHFSAQGLARVYKYTRGDLTLPPKQVYEFTFCNPAELKSKNSFFVFIPVPTLGLLFYHSLAKPSVAVEAGNAEMMTGRGHLIPWETRPLANGDGTLFDPSPARFAINPYQRYHFVFASIRYPPFGTFTDAPFDFGFKPGTIAPACAPILLKANSTWGAASSALRKEDDSGAWALGERKARVKTTLTTTSEAHTPFLYGYGVAREGIRSTRGTTSLLVPRVLKLEWSEDSTGVMEGEAECILEGAAAEAIAERGDTTFLLEKSADAQTWQTHLGGIASEWNLSASVDGAERWHYRARCRLLGMHELLRERRMLQRTAFDGLTMIEALNVGMRVGGFPPITTYPPQLDALRIPLSPGGAQWRHAPKEGDDLWSVLRKLLLLGRGQYREYLLAYDWSSQAWTVVLRPRDDLTRWRLTPRSSSHNPATRTLKYDQFHIEPEPPEANVLCLAGATTADNQGYRITNITSNQDSVSNPASPDYLGRVRTALYTCKELSDQAEVNKMLRRLSEILLYRTLKSSVNLSYYHDALPVNARVEVLDMQGIARPEAMWVKRRTVVITPGNYGGIHGAAGYAETTTLELDSIWENDVE
jgi:hypothetical protein